MECSFERQENGHFHENPVTFYITKSPCLRTGSDKLLLNRFEIPCRSYNFLDYKNFTYKMKSCTFHIVIQQ